MNKEQDKKIEAILRGYLPYTGVEDKHIPYSQLVEELSTLLTEAREEAVNDIVWEAEELIDDISDIATGRRYPIWQGTAEERLEQVIEDARENIQKLHKYAERYLNQNKKGDR